MAKKKVKIIIRRKHSSGEKPYNGLCGEIVQDTGNDYIIFLDKTGRNVIRKYNDMNCSAYTYKPIISKDNVIIIHACFLGLE